MNIWTNEEIESILSQLNQRNLPFPKYRFTGLGEGLRLLGRGGFAMVYEAESVAKGRADYAIKVIGFGEKHVDSKFFRESVQVQKDLGGNLYDVVPILEYNEILVTMDERGRVTRAEVVVDATEQERTGNVLKLQFILMRKLETVITSDRAGKPKLRPAKLAELGEEEILKLAYDIGRTLAAAHDRNVLHRDVKLENVFYNPKDGHYKLGDFGIARKTEDGMASTITFTKGYGAPEVVGSGEERYDNTADIYSFGIMLYVLVNGLRFPESENYNVNLTAQYRQGYRLPRPAGGSDALWRIIDKMCRFDPDERYQSMGEVLEEIDGLLFNATVQYQKKHKEATGFVAILLLLSGVVLWKLVFGTTGVTDAHWSFYLLISLGIFKSLRGLYRKNDLLLNLLILVAGVCYMAFTGFHWMKPVWIFILVGSSELYGAAISGALLVANITEKLAAANLLPTQGLEECAWIPVTVLSLAFLLGYQYLLMNIPDTEKRKKNMGRQKMFDISAYFVYALLIILGGVMARGNSPTLARIMGWRAYEMFCFIDFVKVGIVGFLFIGGWKIRERIMMKMTAIQKEDEV